MTVTRTTPIPEKGYIGIHEHRVDPRPYVVDEVVTNVLTYSTCVLGEER